MNKKKHKYVRSTHVGYSLEFNSLYSWKTKCHSSTTILMYSTKH
jgi:hypothetical protein